MTDLTQLFGRANLTTPSMIDVLHISGARVTFLDWTVTP